MLVHCQNCKAKYKITVKKKPGKGVSFKCGKCGSMVSISAEEIVAQEAATAPKPQTVKAACEKCGNIFIKPPQDGSSICNQCRIDSLVKSIKGKYGFEPPPEPEAAAEAGPAGAPPPVPTPETPTAQEPAPEQPAPEPTPAAAPESMPRYTVRSADGLVLGPIKFNTVKILARDRRINGLNEVSKDGGEFKPLMSFPELAELFPELKEIMDTTGLDDKVDEAFMAAFSDDDGAPQPNLSLEPSLPEPAAEPLPAPEPEVAEPSAEEPLPAPEPEVAEPPAEEPLPAPEPEVAEPPIAEPPPTPEPEVAEPPAEEPLPAPEPEVAEPPVEPPLVELEKSIDLNEPGGHDDDAIMSMDDVNDMRLKPAEAEEQPTPEEPATSAEPPKPEEPPPSEADEIVELETPAAPEPTPEPAPGPPASAVAPHEVGTEFDISGDEEEEEEPVEEAEEIHEPEEIIEDLHPISEPPPNARYRIRYPDGLILGPVKIGTIRELYQSGNLTGQEDVQREDDPWCGFTDLPELVGLLSAGAEEVEEAEVIEGNLIELNDTVKE